MSEMKVRNHVSGLKTLAVNGGQCVAKSLFKELYIDEGSIVIIDRTRNTSELLDRDNAAVDIVGNVLLEIMASPEYLDTQWITEMRENFDEIEDKVFLVKFDELFDKREFEVTYKPEVQFFVSYGDEVNEVPNHIKYVLIKNGGVSNAGVINLPKNIIESWKVSTETERALKIRHHLFQELDGIETKEHPTDNPDKEYELQVGSDPTIYMVSPAEYLDYPELFNDFDSYTEISADLLNENIRFEVSFDELKMMGRENWSEVHFVASQNNWEEELSEYERTFTTGSSQKVFDDRMGGNSMFSKALDEEGWGRGVLQRMEHADIDSFYFDIHDLDNVNLTSLESITLAREGIKVSDTFKNTQTISKQPKL